MARVIVALALLIYAGAGIASAYLPQSRMPTLVVVAGAALVMAALGLTYFLGKLVRYRPSSRLLTSTWRVHHSVA